MKHMNVDNTKIYMIQSFSIIGFIYLFFFGIKGIMGQNTFLSILLLSGSAILAFNMFYLSKTKNYNTAGYILLYFFSVLMLYLIYTGGVDNTGHLWIFFLAPLIFYVTGLKKGLYFIVFFVFSMIVIFYILDPEVQKVTYDDSYKLRIIASFLVVTLISGAYAFSQEKSAQHVIDTQKELEYLLVHDDLTNLYNRRAYHTEIKTIEDIKGSFFMCDIDNFKIINDKYGHAAGDYVIKEVAKCIQDNIKHGDIPIRWGGEEFFIFLRNMNIDNAYVAAERLRMAVENCNINYNNQRIHVTISIGVSSLTSDITIIEDAVKKADDAMYHSKRDGRNKTSVIY